MEDRFKFRAWDKEIKSMVFDAEFFPFFTIGDINIDDKYILLQCTGLKDRNGKMIYEGDILKVAGKQTDETIGFVEWVEDFAGFKLNVNSNNIYMGFDYLPENEREIIGNIYQNTGVIE